MSFDGHNFFKPYFFTFQSDAFLKEALDGILSSVGLSTGEYTN
jgi:hypothetical protein